MQLLSLPEILLIHDRTITEHGGTPGLRDHGALESALAAVRNRQLYENADLVQCAATYAYHLSQAHAFLDGNKRIAAQTAEIFLLLNGLALDATNDELAELFLGIAASAISREQIEQQFTKWTLTKP
jgi:death on curing protein